MPCLYVIEFICDFLFLKCGNKVNEDNSNCYSAFVKVLKQRMLEIATENNNEKMEMAKF